MLDLEDRLLQQRVDLVLSDRCGAGGQVRVGVARDDTLVRAHLRLWRAGRGRTDGQHRGGTVSRPPPHVWSPMTANDHVSVPPLPAFKGPVFLRDGSEQYTV